MEGRTVMSWIPPQQSWENKMALIRLHRLTGSYKSVSIWHKTPFSRRISNTTYLHVKVWVCQSDQIFAVILHLSSAEVSGENLDMSVTEKKKKLSVYPKYFKKYDLANSVDLNKDKTALNIATNPSYQNNSREESTWSKLLSFLTLVLLNPDIPCLCKQCRSRSVGFFRSQLIWICTVCH